MRIVYCLNSITEGGGIASVTVTKANALSDVPGNEIFICVSDHEDHSLLTKKLSSKVNLIDLNIDYYKDDWKSKLHVLKGIVIKRIKHRKRLKKHLKEINPDIVISVGLCEKYLLPKIKGSAKIIREFHSPKNYRLLLSNNKWDCIKAYIENIYDYKWKVKRYDQIVVLTEKDRALNWQDYKNVISIPNPVSFSSNKKSLLTNKKIITMGRLTKEKNQASFIRAFATVASVYPDWMLEIYGEGVLKKDLQKLIENKGLTDLIKIMGKTSNSQEVYSESSIFVLTSRFEGFGLVILEAMACGLPVVSYDCPYGPRDIVSDGVDGFLVPFGDEKNLAEKISFLIEHPEIRKKMGEAAIEKSKNYTLDKIIPLWMKLFESLISNNIC